MMQSSAIASRCVVLSPPTNVKLTQKLPSAVRSQLQINSDQKIDLIPHLSTNRKYIFEMITQSETTMLRLKVIFGGKLRRRKFDTQAVELFIQLSILNRMIQNCKPESYKVEF
ncbi:MAG: hypothetical protein F6K18_32485 [Okeania sp. SIO2C2]|uniref:hypothetical protein n=1 Tax=Okeania sp. SIO2C2 TaxID=2607787 RepID=UPI0013BDAFD8|nr:hypothetical protein [Okeania sp. SIO2C2]NEP91146.1 hypothetical protein [Okeania sp. SIO2C2]